MNIILTVVNADGTELDERSFAQGLVCIGRDAGECEIVFEGESFAMVSRKHAEIRWHDGKWLVVDLNSSYGTFLDGRRVTAPESLHAGNVLQFGEDGPLVRIVWFEVFTESVPPGSDPKPTIDAPPVVAIPQSFSPPQNNATESSTPASAFSSPSAKLEFVGSPDRPPVNITIKGISIGRDPMCEVAFSKAKVMVSRRHALVRIAGADIVIEDNGSFNGTYVNENRIAGATALNHGDTLRFGIGGPELRLDYPAKKAAAEPAATPKYAVDGAADPKTMVARLNKTPIKAKPGTIQSHLMMTRSFGDKGELSVGRGEANDIRLDGLQISTQHARLLKQNGEVLIEDLGSTNGVFLNGNRVSRSSFTSNDRVQIASFELRLDSAGNIGAFDTRSKTRIDAVNISKEITAKGGKLRLLDLISLTVQPNEFIGLLGPSGAGKSMLMDALNGVRPPTSGNVLINNLDLYSHLDSLKQAIGYVPQDDIIHRELTVYRTLYYVAKLRLSRDVSAAEINQTINEALDVTGLSDRRDVQVSQLSGGQRKRVSIAVELITKPSIIFLDEPTSGLDPGSEDKIMRLFRQIAESGRTVILTTHAMENVRLFDKIAILMRGHLVFFGPPLDALKHLGASSFKELYDKLEEPVETRVKQHGETAREKLTDQTADEWAQKFRRTPQYQMHVAVPQQRLGQMLAGGARKRSRLGITGAARQWFTLTRRYLEILLKDKVNLLILFAQAPIIALMTFFVLGADRPRDFAYFVIAIVSIWFGTSVAAREIIREKPVYLRERMVNLGIFPYLASKITVLGIIVAVQCIFLFVPLKIFDLVGVMAMPGEMLGIPQFWTMLVSGVVGIALGLFISTIVKSVEMATSLVPLVLIPQILFSGIAGVPTGVSKPLSLLVPAAWSFDTMKRYSTLDTLEKEGADLKGKSEGLGLYKQIETDNEKILTDARKNLEDYQGNVEKTIQQYDDARSLGLTPTLTKPNELPAVPNVKKLPKDLSGYITFLHPWMNEILNQFVLMLMFGILGIATLILLRLKDIR